MRLQVFTSESYSEADRLPAWQRILATVGLRARGRAGPEALGVHATATIRGQAEGVVVARLIGGSQTLLPTAGKDDLPLLCCLEEHGAQLRRGEVSATVTPPALLLLPRCGAWDLMLPRGLRATVLSVKAAALRGRRIGVRGTEAVAAVLGQEGLPPILSRTLLGAGESLPDLSDTAWGAVEASLVELYLGTLTHVLPATPEGGGSAAQAALLYRLQQAIEQRLNDPDLAPASVAEAVGISERYLQKVFEGHGDSFSRYLREQRLGRAAADLSNPAAAALPVSEIGYRNGFNDAAHFSRTFRERFGMSPRDYRQQEAESRHAMAAARGQRGRPQDAPVAARSARIRLLETLGAGTPPGTLPAQGPARSTHHHLAVEASRVHWGFFSRSLAPQLEIASGDTVTVETLTQHASDDPALMIAGDPGAESVFHWAAASKGVERRGAGPLDGSIYGRGAGEGFGVHICTGPIAVRDAQPGDVLEVRILDMVPRPSRNPHVAGRVFGSSVAAWWGYHYGELLHEPRPREVVTIYEVDMAAAEPHARALYSYRWTPQTDPFGVLHRTYDYPGVPVAADTVVRRPDTRGIRIPLRPHFGVVALAPKEMDLVDSVPPAYFGGNIDNWRLGKGAAVYLPVSVPGALLSIGDPHAAQGDGELGGTAIECSMTGTFAVTLHKKADLGEGILADLTYPLIETAADWVLTGFSHPNYLAEFGAKGQSEVYARSSLDLAMKDAFRKARRFLMSASAVTEDEAIALISAAVDFGVTQVVDGNWGVHAVVSKRLLSSSPAFLPP